MKKVFRDISVNRAESLKDQLLRARDKVVLEKLKIENHFELVEEINGIKFINDCHAIDLNACMATIDAQEEAVIWICYSPPMGRDLLSMRSLIQEKVKGLFCIGDGFEFVFDAFANDIELLVRSEDIEEALLFANKYASTGDTVIFSPGSPNYGFFESSSDWNAGFTEALKKLKSA